MDIVYNATPTLSRFHRSDAFYRGVRGPVRSGKSTAMCNEIMRRALQQQPDANGVRRTRWVIVRNTYGELRDTTLVTWQRCFPPDRFGDIHQQTMTHKITLKGLDMAVLFRALDRPDDVKKLLSLEVTGAWVNEAREVPKAIIDTLGDRVGQYPSRDIAPCTWRGVMMDTNSPDDDHWWFFLEESPPRGFEFFVQPGGLIEKNGEFLPNPAAENVHNLNESDYYMTRMAGKKPEYIRVYYCNQFGFTVDGKPVIPEYVDALHCPSTAVDPVPGIPIRVGIDWGLTPAATFGQRLPNGRWIVTHELTTEHMGAKKFGALFAVFVNETFPGFELEHPTGDPSGMSGSQADDEDTCFLMFNTALRDAGVELSARPADTNDAIIRHGALSDTLSRIIDGKPGLVVSSRCKKLRKGLAGGYCYRRLQVSGEDRYQDKPEKNQYSHPVESLEYMLIGAGEGRALVRPKSPRATRPDMQKVFRR